MAQFFDTDAEVVSHPRLDILYVEADGYRITYNKALKYLKRLVKEQDLPIDELTMMDVSRAYNEDIVAYIRDNGEVI